LDRDGLRHRCQFIVAQVAALQNFTRDYEKLLFGGVRL
jgi:hypothetical protein